MKTTLKYSYLIFLILAIILPNTVLAETINLVDSYTYEWELNVVAENDMAIYYKGTMTSDLKVTFSATGIFLKSNNNLTLASRIQVPFTYSVDWNFTSGAGAWINDYELDLFGPVTVYIDNISSSTASKGMGGDKLLPNKFYIVPKGPVPGIPQGNKQ